MEVIVLLYAKGAQCFLRNMSAWMYVVRVIAPFFLNIKYAALPHVR